MKKFIFKLQRLLEIRGQKEKRIKDELMLLNARLYLEQDKLSEYQKVYEDTNRSIKALKQSGKITPDILSDYQIYIQSQLQKIESQQKRVNDAKKNVDAKMVEYIAASKDRKIIDKLKDNQKYAYLWELDKTEQKQTDEIAIAVSQSLHPAKISPNTIKKDSI